MTAPAPHLDDLSADHRRELESLLLQFDRSWDEKRLPAALRQLPAGGALRRPALIEMIKIDLERRRKAGQKIRIDAYLKSFPELGTAEDLPVDLILAEYQVRRQFGTAPDLEDYGRRFPRQVEDLRRRVVEADREATAAGVAAADPSTLRPEQAKRSTVRPGGVSTPVELPEQFGRYKILKCLGRGGMGSVYLAHDAQLDRQVALKAPHFSSGDGAEVLERFSREARAAATIDHPNICPVYDVGVHDGVHYVTMAYVEGRPLSDLIQDGKAMPPQVAAAVVRKLALALAEAHRHGVIHRDLKPANVMVNRRKEPVIMDFGLARRVNKDDERLTKTGHVLGTPAYMPPEQVAGDVQAMGPACDVYSLGVMLYEMLTGRLPFQGSLAAVLGQILTKAPEPPSKLRPGLDPALEAICLKAMAKKPKDRFASMDDMADALTAYLKGEPAASAKTKPAAAAVSKAKGRLPAAAKKGGPATEPDLAENLLAKLVDRLDAHPSRAAESPPPPPRGTPWWVPLGGALVIVVGVLVVVLLLVNRMPTITVSPNITNTNTVAVQLAGLTDRLNDATITFILDGKTVSKEQLSQPISLATGDHVLVVKRDDAVIETRKFAVGGKDDKQTVQLPPPADGGTPVVKNDKPGADDKPKPPAKPKDPIVLEGHTGAVMGLVFSPDGMTLASGSNDKTIVLWDVAKGKERKTLNDKARVSGVALSSDGGTLASGRADAGDAVAILWDMQTSKKTALTPPEESHDDVRWVAFSPDGKSLAVQCYHVIRMWDLSSEKVIGKNQQSNNLSGPMVFSRDGALLGIPCADSKVLLWDTATRKEKVLEGHAKPVTAVSFSPNGKTLASGSADRTVKLWDLASGEVIDNLKGYEDSVWGVQYTPDGKALVTAAGNSFYDSFKIKIWDVSGARPTELPKAQDLPLVWRWRIAPDGKTVALSYLDKVVNSQVVVLWDLYTGEERARAVVKQQATAMAFSADGRWLAWGQDDGKVMLWEVGLKAPAPAKVEPPPVKSKDPALLEGHTRRITSFVFSPDGKYLYTGGLDNSVLVWDVAAHKQKVDLPHTDNVMGLTLSPDGAILTVGQKDGGVTQWDVPAGTKRASTKVPSPNDTTKELYSVARLRDGNLLAAKFIFGTVVWDPAKERPVATIQQNNSYVSDWGDLALSPDGKLLAVPRVDKDVVLWDVGTQKERRLKGHADPVTAAVFSPNGKTLASGSSDKTVKLWDAASGDIVANLRGHDAAVWSVQFSADGKTLASWADKDSLTDLFGGADVLGRGGVVKVWDVEGRKEIPVGKGLSRVSAYVLGPDGKSIAVSSFDEALKQWVVRVVDVTTGEDRATYKDTHGRPAALMAISTDGVLAWTHADGTLMLWDVGMKVPER